MSGLLERALYLADKGFYVFPLVSGTKVPLIDGWETKASRDPAQISRWWRCPVMEIEQDHNIGIHTGMFGDDRAPLCVLDVDTKNGVNGNTALDGYSVMGNDLPETITNETPTGGTHIIMLSPRPVKNSAGKLAAGLDIRGHNGYIVGPWSVVPSGEYKLQNGFDHPAVAPEWLLELCETPSAKSEVEAGRTLPGIDPERARERAMVYLMLECPPAGSGNRNHEGFRVAAMLKDFGLDAVTARELMVEQWPCEPMLDNAELDHVIRSAFKYGREARGSRAPEAVFAPTSDEEDAPAEVAPSPMDSDAIPVGSRLPGTAADGNYIARLNIEFSMVLNGGSHSILWDRTECGARKQTFLKEGTFHALYASNTVVVSDRQQPCTDLWMRDRERRTFTGIDFLPEKSTAPRLNLWTGFAVKPARSANGDRFVKDYWMPHVRDTACGGADELAHWLMSAYAHSVQKPWEKLEVAMVFMGGKGVGKNKLADSMLPIFGEHGFGASSERYISSNFNAHLEAKIWTVFDEATWAGNKSHGGVLKDLVTGKYFQIERKGLEPYKSPNLTRLTFLSNDSWVVPASEDERRYACFKFGTGRQRDYAFFGEWDRLYDNGGKEGLLQFLMSYDISGFNPRLAPQTDGLLEQKHETLDPMHSWWLDSMREGRVAGSDMQDWPEEMECDRFRAAYRRYMRERNINTRSVDDRMFGKYIKACAGIKRVRKREGLERMYIFDIGTLDSVRAKWDAYIGHKCVWDDYE